MRENFERLIAWARAHPWLTALILGAVIALGYIAYRRYGGGGGGNGEGELFEPAEPTPPNEVSEPDLGLDSSIPTFPTPSLSGGEYTTPVETFPSIPAMYAEQVPAFEFPIPSTAGAFAEYGLSGSQDIAAYAMPEREPPAILAKQPSPQTSGAMATAALKPAKKPTKKPPKGKQTPTQLLGKGKNFTGWIGSTYYKNGYPLRTDSYEPSFTPQYISPAPSVAALQALYPNVDVMTGYVKPSILTPTGFSGGSLTSYFGGSV